MQVNKLLLWTTIMYVTLQGCIDRFPIGGEVEKAGTLVISGTITNDTSIHTLEVSTSSKLEWYAFNGLQNCYAKVIDKFGNKFYYHEDKPGKYSVTIPTNIAKVGNAFKLSIFVPGFGSYESTWEEILPCPDIDSVYYNIETHYTDNKNIVLKGIQLYADFTGIPQGNTNFMWSETETYEYHAYYPYEYYYRGRIMHVQPDYSKMVCYQTAPINYIRTLNTKNLVENRYRRYPLTYVDNRTLRLKFGYSMKVDLMSVTEDAYYYWETIRENSQESGGLYEKQPAIVHGNIVSTEHPEEKVLGYFGASARTSKRIFVKPIEGFVFNTAPYCVPFTDLSSLAYTRSGDWPIYLAMDPNLGLGIVDHACVDCTVSGGTTQKPYFWQ